MSKDQLTFVEDVDLISGNMVVEVSGVGVLSFHYKHFLYCCLMKVNISSPSFEGQL